MDIDSILAAMDRLDADRDKIRQAREDLINKINGSHLRLEGSTPESTSLDFGSHPQEVYGIY